MKKIKIALLFILIHNALLFSQDGVVDLTFNTPVHPTAPSINGFSGEVRATKMLSNGKLLVFGDLNQYMGVSVNKLVLLHPDGSIDSGFTLGTGPNYSHVRERANSGLIAEQSDGKILIGGEFTTFNGISANRIIRLHPNGNVDASFNVGSGFNSSVNVIKIQNDGKILCGGNFTSFNGTTAKHILRLNNDGSLDTTFNSGSGADHTQSSDPGVRALEELPDGKIIVGGFFTSFNTIPLNHLVRLNSNGSVDHSFAIGSGVSFHGSVNKIRYQSQSGKILIAGKIHTFNTIPTKHIVLVNLDGSIDTTFNPTTNIDPDLSTFGIRDFEVLSNGKIIVCGNFSTETNYDLFLYNPDGSDDTDFSFSNVQSSNTPFITTLSIDGNDGIYAAGFFQNINYSTNRKGSIVKIHADGSTDIAFNPNLGTRPSSGGGIQTALVLNNDKILVSSLFYNERERKTFSINKDGSVFDDDLSNFTNLDLFHAKSIKSTTTNKLYIASPFVRRINENGTLDNTFSSTSNLYTPPIFNVVVNDMLEQPDSKLIIAGIFQLGSINYQNIARLNPDGSVDNSFNVGNGFQGLNSPVNAMLLQQDNKIVAVGNFNAYNGVLNVNRIVRLNPNGTLDPTFLMGTGFNDNARKIVLTNDNKLFICGRFTQYNGVLSPYIIKLNPDGSVDNSFNSPFTEGDFFTDSNTIAVQPNGKILISIYYNGVQKLFRLHPDGSIDTTFVDNVFINTTGGDCSPSYDRIKSLTLFDDKILVTGCFDYLNEYRRVGIARLNNSDGTLGLDSELMPETTAYIYPNPVARCFSIAGHAYYTIELYTINGVKVYSGDIVDNSVCIDHLKPALYLAKLKGLDGSEHTLKVVKD